MLINVLIWCAGYPGFCNAHYCSKWTTRETSTIQLNTS